MSSPILQQAIHQANQLSSYQQDVLGKLLMEIMRDELQWEEKFANNPEVLESLYEDALKDIA